MRRFRISLLVAVVAAIVTASSAAAQATSPPPSLPDGAAQKPAAKPVPRPPVVYRAFGLFESDSYSASRSFDAALGTSRLSGFGAGGEVTRLWRGAFVRFSFARTRETGSRAWVIDGEVIQNDVPLTLTLTPVELGGGWRHPLDRRGRVTGYGGVNLLWIGYNETAEFASADENTQRTHQGFALYAGIDVDVWKWVWAGAEVQQRLVGGAIGKGGLSESLGESSLGGFTVRVLVGVRR